MYMKICVVGEVLDVITCAKFQSEIFRGYDFTGGRFFHFSYWFWMGLTTVQRYCAACDTAGKTASSITFDPLCKSYALIESSFLFTVTDSKPNGIKRSLKKEIWWYVNKATYPVCGTKIDSLCKVVTLVEASVVCSWECDHNLASMLVCPNHLAK